MHAYNFQRYSAGYFCIAIYTAFEIKERHVFLNKNISFPGGYRGMPCSKPELLTNAKFVRVTVVTFSWQQLLNEMVTIG